MRISYIDEFRQFGILTIIARCISSPQPPGENRVAQSIALKKIIGSAEKNRVGRETATTGIFLGLNE
jgi:hypothetical protein